MAGTSIRYNLLLLTLIAVGCGGYGSASEKAYEYAKALYSVCNRKDQDGLENIETLITEAVGSSELTSQEARWLTDIIDDAKDGDWKSASKNARRLMEDQVEK